MTGGQKNCQNQGEKHFIKKIAFYYAFYFNKLEQENVTLLICKVYTVISMDCDSG